MARFPRESIQITARVNGAPSAPTATVPDHWAVQPTPMIRSAAAPPWARTDRAAAVMADHQSSGSCSAPPPGRRCSGTGRWSWATTLPVVDTRATLGPPVPRSMAST